MSRIELSVLFRDNLPEEKLRQIASAMAKQATSYGEEALVSVVIDANSKEDL